MRNLLPSVFAAALVLAPAAALAQYVVQEPPMGVGPEVMAVAPAGPLTEDDAAQIAMMNGMAVVEDVDVRMWDGNFKVEGTDSTGETLVMRIDHDTGQVLDIDD
jgi:hypothetical protein